MNFDTQYIIIIFLRIVRTAIEQQSAGDKNVDVSVTLVVVFELKAH